MKSFAKLLSESRSQPLTSEDCLGLFLPLMQQVIDAHDADLVTQIHQPQQIQTDGKRLFISDAARQPVTFNARRMEELQPAGRSGLMVPAGTDIKVVDPAAISPGELAGPCLLRGYQSWEHLIGCHDPLTDTFTLGLILASLSCGLDLTQQADCESFYSNRTNLFRIHRDLHPVLARAIFVMTDSDRRRRPQDLRALASTLADYRDQEVDFETDLARHETQPDVSRSAAILTKLRERLFEINRRNRLLHFRETMQTVNLTLASIPLTDTPENVPHERVVTWHDKFVSDVLSLKPVLLNGYLNFREAAWLGGSLDRIRLETQRDEADYGFAQLRLVPAFLRWTDLKSGHEDHYLSPLLLLPVRLTRKRGIHDRFHIQAYDSVAEVNPVVRHLFRQMYGIPLPAEVELADEGAEKFARELVQQISASDCSVDTRIVETPRIRLLHQGARRRQEKFRKRARLSGRGIRQFLDVEYSYTSANYHPLGIRLFQRFAAPLPAADKPDEVEQPREASPAATVQLTDETDDNPRNWEIDFCSVAITNLRYRRMSLAQDYHELIEEDVRNSAFESVFSLDDDQGETPTAEADEEQEPDNSSILPSDPTQTAAIEDSLTGIGSIIQGPPGTGKSQTIANLISRFASAGKRVLFVCEKRAAVDVVYQRLKQCGLADLCCRIHDSQADKKQFVMDLKKTYEAFSSESEERTNRHLNLRRRMSKKISELIEPLKDFQNAMNHPVHEDVTLRHLLDVLIQDRDAVPALVPAQWERVPPYGDLVEASDHLDVFESRLSRIKSSDICALHPIRFLRAELVSEQRPVEIVTELLEKGQPLLSQTIKRLADADLPAEISLSFEALETASRFATELNFLLDRDLLNLLDESSEQYRILHALQDELAAQDERLELAGEATRHWRDKFTSQDTQTALKIARAYDGRIVGWFSPTWWKLRGRLKQSYDRSRHAVAPSWTDVLEWLDHEHDVRAERYHVIQKLGDEFHIHHGLDEFLESLKSIQGDWDQLPESFRALVLSSVAAPDRAKGLRILSGIRTLLRDLRLVAAPVLTMWEACSPQEIQFTLNQLEDLNDSLPQLLHCLESLSVLPESLQEALRTLPLQRRQMIAAAAQAELQSRWQESPGVAAWVPEAREETLEKLVESTEALHERSANAVRESVRQEFCDRLRIAEQLETSLNEEERIIRRKYRTGTSQLEHEFGKSMRYRSIRELGNGETGFVLRDMKPVWLMSPLSVSDTLPLLSDHFDAVVFDEASQITLEDAVPALFRAKQTVIVGDEMQLPPTSFFGSRQDDDELEFEEDGQTVHYDLNSSSLLNHAARNIPSVMLGWHYRSRSESLISFSNHAFYGGRLLTVPEEELPQEGIDEIVVNEPVQGAENAAELLRRPVSFHRIACGVYEKRRNTAEAEYIAELVRELLKDEARPSLGVVAFSEAQQSEIDRAVRRLAESDADFAERLEAELEREDDGEFAGLLIRNLENIQGDERDIIILSVCYGPDPEGKVRMNFGPINMAGGEKRLNVAFTRAKKFMALVSSLQHTQITNDYNDGAGCLKRYLQYAQACSIGNSSAAARVLTSLSGAWKNVESATPDNDVLTSQLVEYIHSHGFEVDLNVGQSDFVVDIAVRREGDSLYRLGILIDSHRWYRTGDTETELLERELLKPRLLEAFGWRVHTVFARDWYERQDECMQRLKELLQVDG